MAKSFGCSDVGINCNWTTTGENEEEIRKKIKEHAHSDHGFTEIPPDIAQKVKTAIKDV